MLKRFLRRRRIKREYKRLLAAMERHKAHDKAWRESLAYWAERTGHPIPTPDHEKYLKERKVGDE